MKRYILSEKAEKDLHHIWNFIAADNIEAADRVISRLIDTLRMLLRTPQMGRGRPELASSLRSVPVGSYAIFYRPIDDGIEVLRVIHASRDIPAVFEED